MAVSAVDLDRETIYLDTSALFDIVNEVAHRGVSRAQKQLMEVMGSGQWVVSAVTLAEIARNVHPDVFMSKAAAKGGKMTSSEAHRRAEANLTVWDALLEMASGSGTGWHRRLGVDLVIDRSPSLMALARLRRKPGSLRCTGRDGVTAIGSLADAAILAGAVDLQDRKQRRDAGARTCFASSDKELLGAAARYELEWLDTKHPSVQEPYPWKICNNDEACVQGCRDAPADCDRSYLGPTAPL